MTVGSSPVILVESDLSLFERSASMVWFSIIATLKMRLNLLQGIIHLTMRRTTLDAIIQVYNTLSSIPLFFPLFPLSSLFLFFPFSHFFSFLFFFSLFFLFFILLFFFSFLYKGSVTSAYNKKGNYKTLQFDIGS